MESAMTADQYQAKSGFITEAIQRGFFHQCTDLEGLDALLHEAEQKKQPVAAYIGFDCTAPSLHVGSLMQIMLLRLWQKHGHKPVVLMGGGTTKVGDPSGKDESRKLLDDAGIAANMAGIKKVFSQFLTFGDGASDAVMVNNADWLEKLNYIEFLRDYGRHFSVNRMLSMDSVKLRIEREQHLSFLEFNYMILQAYDFVELRKRYDCRLQFGGSDQWGNITTGTELHRLLITDTKSNDYKKKYRNEDRFAGTEEEALEQTRIKYGSDVSLLHWDGAKEHKGSREVVSYSPLYGFTTPLLTTSSGAKMGKTAAGAVWMNADMLTPYDYWQYWRNTEDSDVGRFLRYFTDMDEAEIAALERAEGAAINEAKKKLATAVTALCHGKDAAEKAQATAAELFEKGGASADMPTKTISRDELLAQPTVAHLLAALEVASSVGEARRDIEKNKCIKFNDELVDNPQTTTSDILSRYMQTGEVKLSKGKKQHWLVKLAA
jgi:tyrosyl-tRNA synthetase